MDNRDSDHFDNRDSYHLTAASPVEHQLNSPIEKFQGILMKISAKDPYSHRFKKVSQNEYTYYAWEDSKTAIFFERDRVTIETYWAGKMTSETDMRKT